MTLKCIVAYFLLLIISASTWADPVLNIHVRKLDTEKQILICELLKLALRKSGANFKITEGTYSTSEERFMVDVKQQKLDVTWAGMLTEKEHKLKAVHIPIFKGLLGYKVLIIKNSKQKYFDAIENEDDLKTVIAGMGTTWSDTPVFEYANLPVIKTHRGSGLWPMLQVNRFDYIPLGIHEHATELKIREGLGLITEKHLMVHYVNALYFYVHPDNQALHDLIYMGMNKAIDDGSYDAFLYNAPAFKTGLAQADIDKRKVIELTNPYIPSSTPLYVKKYWFKEIELYDDE